MAAKRNATPVQVEEDASSKRPKTVPPPPSPKIAPPAPMTKMVLSPVPFDEAQAILTNRDRVRVPLDTPEPVVSVPPPSVPPPSVPPKIPGCAKLPLMAPRRTPVPPRALCQCIPGASPENVPVIVFDNDKPIHQDRNYKGLLKLMLTQQPRSIRRSQDVDHPICLAFPTCHIHLPASQVQPLIDQFNESVQTAVRLAELKRNQAVVNLILEHADNLT